MIDFDVIREAIVSGLRDYLGCPVIRANQTSPQPPYPYASYTITTLKAAHNGTHGEHPDGVFRKETSQIWSFTVQSKDAAEVMTLCLKAHEWLDLVGRTYLYDRGVTVQSVGGINNRDNLLTIEYEYRNGFDFVVACFDEVAAEKVVTEWIETAEIQEIKE